MTCYVSHGHARGAELRNLDRIKSLYQVDEKLFEAGVYLSLLIYLQTINRGAVTGNVHRSRCRTLYNQKHVFSPP